MVSPFPASATVQHLRELFVYMLRQMAANVCSMKPRFQPVFIHWLQLQKQLLSESIDSSLPGRPMRKTHQTQAMDICLVIVRPFYSPYGLGG